MGTLTELDQVRADKLARAAIMAERGARHPALRWLAGDVFDIAHRRTDGVAACGAEGELVLATRAVPLCPECYPGRAGNG